VGEAIANAWVMVQDWMGHWWFSVAWIVYAIGILVIWYMHWRFSERREYKMINGRLCVRHGNGEWLNLEEHLKKKHSDEWEKLNKKNG